MTTFIEGRHAGAFLLSEANGNRSRENLTIAVSQTVEPGTLLRKSAVVADVVAAPSAAGGNTGNATIAMDATAVTNKVKDGRYKGIAVTATTVRWEGPDGKEIGTSTHGQLFAKGGVRLTITAGGTPNAAGDEFYVDVAADAQDYQHVAWAAADGMPDAIALYGAVTPADKTTRISGIVRDATVNGKEIAWPEGVSAGDKANACQALADLGVIVR